MSLAEDLKPLAWAIRSIPGKLGVRPHSVSILKRSWSGPHTGDAVRTDVEVRLLEADGQPPKVRWLSEEQLAVGQLDAGSVQVGPITASFPGGGTDLSDLDGSLLQRGEVRHLLIRGPMHPRGAVYRIMSLKSDHAIHYTITASPAGQANGAPSGG